MLKTIKTLLISVLAVALGLIITLDAENMLAAVRVSIDSCLNTIIPSLFGYMAISSFFMKSGLYLYICKPVYFLLKFIIRLSEEEFSVLLLSLFGGYPVGAKLISDACEINPDSSLKRILPFCYCGSPVFIIAVAGIGIYGNADIGLIIYLSNVLACLLSCILYTIIKHKHITKSITVKKQLNVNGESVINSVISAASSLFPVCAMVVAFGVILEAMNFCGINNLIQNAGIDGSFFRGLFEISKLADSKNLSMSIIPFISSLTSFGGFCILFQIAAIIGSKFNLTTFILARLPIAALSGVICFIMFSFTRIPQEAISMRPFSVLSETGSPIASAALLIMSAFILFSSRKNKTLIIDFKK